MRVAAPNDPKLSDTRRGRAGCGKAAGAKVVGAAGVTAARVRCSAVLGLSRWRSEICNASLAGGAGAANRRKPGWRKRTEIRESEKPGCTQGAKEPETESAASPETVRCRDAKTVAFRTRVERK